MLSAVITILVKTWMHLKFTLSYKVGDVERMALLIKRGVGLKR